MKDFKNYWDEVSIILKWLIGAIIFVGIVLLIIYFYPNKRFSEEKNLGSITDWVGILITSIGTVGVILAFYYQRKQLEEQRNIIAELKNETIYNKGVSILKSNKEIIKESKIEGRRKKYTTESLVNSLINENYRLFINKKFDEFLEDDFSDIRNDVYSIIHNYNEAIKLIDLIDKNSIYFDLYKYELSIIISVNIYLNVDFDKSIDMANALEETNPELGSKVVILQVEHFSFNVKVRKLQENLKKLSETYKIRPSFLK